MTIREEQGSLFNVPQGYHLAHCISGDFALGAGIAKQFTQIYNMREKLKTFFPNFVYAYGEALLVDNVFNLVTKRVWRDKPTYQSITEAIEDLAEQMGNLMINRLAIPYLGCGLDGLDWTKVKEIIEAVFEDTDVEILVCYL